MEYLSIYIRVAVCASMAGAVLYAMYWDVRVFQIPNKISVFIAVMFIPAAAMSGMGMGEFSIHVAVGVLVMLIGMVAFAFRLIGGGDVKLFAAVAVWFGWDLIGSLSLVAAVAGGVLAVVILILRSPIGLPIVSTFWWLGSRVANDKPMPYGIAIGVAALVLFPKISVLPVAMSEWIVEMTPW